MTTLYVKHNEELKSFALPMYEIQNMCEAMVATALKDDRYKSIYESKYKDVKLFSKEFEFCIRELGYMLLDPFQNGSDQVLFSNIESNFIGSFNLISNPEFDRLSIIDNKRGYPLLTNKLLHAKRINEISYAELNNGLVDENGYISSKNIKSLEQLSRLYLLNLLIQSKPIYEDYMEKKDNYQSVSEYLVNELGLVCVIKDDDKINLRYGNNTTGKTLDFVNMVHDIEALENTICSLNLPIEVRMKK